MVTAALLPTLLVVGSLMLVFGLRDAGLWHNLKVPAGRWRWLPFGSLFVLQMFYVVWRVSDTVPPLGWSIEGLWPLVFLVFELSGMLMLSLTYLTLSRKTDRSPEVDEHLGLLGEQTFRVAMFIPTYNEPKAVLERTILGAMSQRYPGVRVYVLDDSRRDWLRDYCRQIGVGYCRRNDNKGAKAGNMNAGLGWPQCVLKASTRNSSGCSTPILSLGPTSSAGAWCCICGIPRRGSSKRRSTSSTPIRFK